MYLLFSGAMSFRLQEGFDYLLQYALIFTCNAIWAVIAFYFMYMYGYRFLEQKKYLKYFLLVSSFSIGLVIVFFGLYKYLIFKEYTWLEFSYFYTSIPGTFVIANCGSLLRGFINWFDAVAEKNELERSTIKHELESLRAQINPHFLFNTLNNIDALIYSNQEKASESLLRLSDIMRYILYIGNEKTISIHKEIEHIENIIALQSLRYSAPGYVSISKDIKCSKAPVAPLLFTPFIENAFKYSMKHDTIPGIEIYLKCIDEVVHFSCKNYFDPERTTITDGQGGIGLSNVKRRLQLLYPERHNLRIQQKNNIFEVELELKIR